MLADQSLQEDLEMEATACSILGLEDYLKYINKDIAHFS